LLRINGNALNVSLDIKVGNETDYNEDSTAIYVGGYATFFL